MQTKMTIESIEIDGEKPYFAVGSFEYTDPQSVGDGDDIILTNGGFLSAFKKMNGNLKLSLAGVSGNMLIIKKLKDKPQYNTLTINAKDGFGALFQFSYKELTRKTALSNTIGIESSTTTDIEFSYGKDVVIS